MANQQTFSSPSRPEESVSQAGMAVKGFIIFLFFIRSVFVSAGVVVSPNITRRVRAVKVTSEGLVSLIGKLFYALYVSYFPSCLFLPLPFFVFTFR